MQQNQEYELVHYGVAGMKWGVRRGKADKAYAKASKKLARLDKKVGKREKKAIKKSDKADKLDSKFFFRNERKIRRAQGAAKRAGAKYATSVKKAEKWVKAMDKTFKNTGISLTKEQQALGKRYTEIRQNRALNRY